jgi:pimeloyl-ACP methyl ester carboxylesterase
MLSSFSGVELSVGKAGREGGEPMPVAYLNATELFYVEVGEGTPCLVIDGGLGFNHTCLHPWLDHLGDVMHLVYYDHRGNGRSGRPPSSPSRDATHDRRTFHGHARSLPTFAASPS